MSSRRDRAPGPGSALTVLVVHRGLLTREAESSEVQQQIYGMLTVQPDRRALDVLASDCRFVYRAVLHDDEVRYCRLGRLRGTDLPIDVAHVHMPVPAVHLVTAVLLRGRGVPVALSPMGMLATDFARSTWFGPRRGGFSLVKPAVVAGVRQAWLLLAHRFICISLDEAQVSRLPRARSAGVPWTHPSTGLGQVPPVATGGATPACEGPVAVVARYDVHRKGLDRLAAWLVRYEDSLPKPAAVLFAPHDGSPSPLLDALVDRGLLQWDQATTGSALLGALARCRAVMLLSRWEAMARALREAAVLGLPTITTATGSFARVQAVLGTGRTVDGDDPAAVHEAFEAAAAMPRDRAEHARSLFDPVLIGAFLLRLLDELAAGQAWDSPDYYEHWAQHRAQHLRPLGPAAVSVDQPGASSGPSQP